MEIKHVKIMQLDFILSIFKCSEELRLLHNIIEHNCLINFCMVNQTFWTKSFFKAFQHLSNQPCMATE